MIKQSLLRDIQDRRAILADLRSAFEAAKADLDRIEQEVIDMVEVGEAHEPGALTAGVSVEAVRRPKWKEAYTRALGADAAARVVRETVPTEHRRLVVIERAPRGRR